jgi:hypothetical protein
MIGRAKDISGKRRAARALAICLALLAMITAAACSGGPDAPESIVADRPPATLKAGIDKAVANPGDIITFTLQAEYASDVTLELPDIADKFSEFRIVDSGETAPDTGADIHIAQQWYKLQADTAGSYVIDPLEVAYTLPDGAGDTLRTPKIFLEITTLLSEEAGLNDIRDVKPPVEILHPYRLALIIAAVALIAILAVLIGRRVFARWRRRAAERKLAARPPHEEALKALERLLGKELVEKGQSKRFCFEISEIFRRYIHGRFDIPAVDLTTEEILPRFDEDGVLAESHKPIARGFLTSTDLVKFAKYLPSRDEIDKIVRDTRAFINETAAQDDEEADAALPVEGGAAR